MSSNGGISMQTPTETDLDISTFVNEFDSFWDVDALEPVDFLNRLVPDTTQDMLSLLEQNDYDFTRVFDMIYKGSTSQTSKKGQICRHFMAGHCARADCWYSHDLEAKVCKFWLQGNCLKGDQCDFAHSSQIYGYLNNQIEPTFEQNQQLDMETDFPCLPRSKPSQSSSSLDSLRMPIIEQSVQKGKKKKLVLDIWSQQPTYSPSHEFASQKERQTKIEKLNLPYFTTGSEVNELYWKHRQDAVSIAKERNEYFNRARIAFQSKQFAQAKKLAQIGRTLNDKMNEIHRQASEQIFLIRNKGLEQHLIDLHGLYPDEAIYYLNERLELLQSQFYSGKVYVIAGSGKHSRDGKSRLFPAVKESLQGRYDYKEGSLNDRKGGVLVIYL